MAASLAPPAISYALTALKQFNWYAALPQEAVFAVKNQNCAAPFRETWASNKIRLDYRHGIRRF
jgi:hypothetical protein